MHSYAGAGVGMTYSTRFDDLASALAEVRHWQSQSSGAVQTCPARAPPFILLERLAAEFLARAKPSRQANIIIMLGSINDLSTLTVDRVGTQR
jgi:hypothetical protein